MGRFLTWNVRKSFSDMGSDPHVMGLLQRYDFVGLTETGSDDGTGPGLPGFARVCVMPRENGNARHGHTGGVALFVREALAPRISIARKHVALGILWVRVAPPAEAATAAALHVAVCYMPHETSKIYTNGAGDLEAQWATLRQDLAEFTATGCVVLMGDFNAHTGSASEVVGGADNPCPRLSRIPARASMDGHAINTMGAALLELCSTYGLVILNGRLPGDPLGCTTHQGPKGSPVLLDYVISSPQLAFSAAGMPLPKCWLRVLEGGDLSKLPTKPETKGKYDHAPVGAGIRLMPPGTTAHHATRAAGGGTQTARIRWAWRPELQEAWAAQVGQASSLTHWQGLASMPSEEALRAFTTGLSNAVGELHAKCKRVIVRAGAPAQHRPTNGWYDEACTEARHTRRAAEQQHGRLSLAARAAHRAYRQTCAKARAAFQQQRADSMLTNVYNNPRAFWRTFRAEPRADSPITLDQWTTYFKGMFQANLAGDYCGGSVEAHCQQHASLFPEATPEARQLAAHLNLPFTDSEVQAALARLPGNKAAGVDGMPAEFLTGAWAPAVDAQGRTIKHYTLGPYLAQLFSVVLAGTYPDAWGISALAPVPKANGRVDDPSDYRGIAVGAVLAKLYSLCLFCRMDAWAEGQGLRAKGQAGFRAGHTPMDNCLVLRHLAESATAAGRPLFVAFIDFSKAYDRIDRALLWRVLGGAGLHGPALNTLQQMYSCVRMQVRCKGELGTEFEAGVGVKQGCPLSPLLFGIYLDRLEGFLEARCPGEGARLGGALVRALLYADDIALTSDTAAGLQRMLDALHEFCLANSMFVNQKKSEVVVFGAGPTSAPGFSCGGKPLEVKPSYKYLGLTLSAQGAPASMLSMATTKAAAVLRALLGRCYRLKIHNPNLQGHLFDALVRPLLCYGCEIWGPDAAADPCKPGKSLAGSTADKDVHLVFARQSLGVGARTPVHPLLAELGRQPMAAAWLRAIAKLWNRALKRNPDDYLRLALGANVHEATRRGAQHRGMWAFEFTTCLARLGLEGAWGAPTAPTPIDLGALGRAIKERWKEQGLRDVDEGCRAGATVREIPDSASRGFMIATHERWFQADCGWVRKDTFGFHLQSHRAVRTVARMRLGMHCLAIQSGRMVGGQKVPRDQRTCPCCQAQREDEFHLVVECPAYQAHRESHRELLTRPGEGWTDNAFRERMNPKTKMGWEDLASFLSACFETRTSKLDAVSAGAPHGRTRRDRGGPRN